MPWFLGRHGPYETDESAQDASDVAIPAPPTSEAVWDVQQNSWRAPTQTELNAEKDAEVERQIDELRVFKALVLWIAELHGITPADARTRLKEIYRSLA